MNANYYDCAKFAKITYYVDVMTDVSITCRIDSSGEISGNAHKVNCIPLNKMLVLFFVHF